MTKIYCVGFNGYKQWSNLPEIIHKWTCIPFEEIICMQCTHRFIIVETKQEFLLLGTTGNNNLQSIKKPKNFDCFGCSDEYLLACENNNVWKYYFDSAEWVKLNLSLTVPQQQAIWSEKENKIIQLTFLYAFNEVTLLVSNGTVWTLSDSNKLQLKFPYDVDKAIEIASGFEHTLILTESGCVLAYGNGSRGQLGTGDLNATYEPVQIEALEGLKITKISAGGWHSCAITESRDLCTWGWNNYGQLAAFENDAEIPMSTVPIFVDVGTHENLEVIDVECGSRHTVVKLSNGDLYATGWNFYSQLGVDNSSEKFAKFTKCSFINSLNMKLICGPWYTIVIDQSAN